MPISSLVKHRGRKTHCANYRPQTLLLRGQKEAKTVQRGNPIERVPPLTVSLGTVSLPPKKWYIYTKKLFTEITKNKKEAPRGGPIKQYIVFGKRHE